MNRYTFQGMTPVKQFDPAQEALDISQDVAAAEALYAELVEADHAVDEISDVLENLHHLSDVLVKSFYSEEAISTLNATGDLTSITGCSTEAITPQIAQEAIGDQIKSAWEALKKFIANVVDTIANFFAKLFNLASAQAQKIIDTKAADIDFSLEKETLTADQVKKLMQGCEALNNYVSKHIDVTNKVVTSNVVATKTVSASGAVSGSPEIVENSSQLNQDISVAIANSKDILKADNGKITIIDAALKREKKVLSTAGWTASGAVELAKYFLDNKNKATRLGTLMKRLKSFNVQVNSLGKSGFELTKTAVRAETSAYACYAKCLRAFGKQVKTLNGANKKNTK